MPNRLVIIFLVLSIIFALVHIFAMKLSLYWFHWWFDILMHFWGGTLIGLGVHALATLPKISHFPTTKLVLIVLFVATVSWEIFERAAGLYDPATYVIDTSQDIILGFSGGLLAHFLLRAYRMK